MIAPAAVDGFVSLEVSPLLAYDAKATTAVAQVASPEGRPTEPVYQDSGNSGRHQAIEEAIFAGVTVNVTLLFNREQYLASAEAYMRGLERRVAAGLSADVRSVASLFVSRWDKATMDKVPGNLRNKLGIAVGTQMYKAYRDLLESDRWQRLENSGARPQRLLFASTGTKDPKASDVLYIARPGGAEHGQHHARRDVAGLRRSRQAGGSFAARRRRCAKTCLAISPRPASTW